MGSEHFASGNWRVKEGSEQEFIERWRNWLSSTTASVHGFGSARLLQDAGDPRHFVSFSDWDDAGSRDAWKAGPEFASGMAACRELCDDFQGADFSQVAAV
jgi:heme-degrading monooxygenase HmoA